MFGAAIICSDEACAEECEVVVAELSELEALACDSCECCVQVLAVWDADAPPPRLRVVRDGSGLRLAA